MKLHYDNLSLESIVYLDDNGIENTEIWKDLPDYEGYYQVSDLGRVKSLSRLIIRKNFKSIENVKCTITDRILRQIIGSHNYFKVKLYKDCKVKTFQIHVLVAISFLNHRPDGTHKIVVDHKINIRDDNRLSNLQLITQRKNTSKDKKNKSSKYTGVYFDKKRLKWESRINVLNKKIYLGRFDTEEEASEYYENAVKSINENKEIVSKIKNKSSIYKNVYFDKRSGRFNFFIDFKEKRIIRSFSTEIEAFLGFEKFKKENGVI